MEEADFSSANLTKTVFNDCDLSAAIFENSNLEEADLSSAFNFSIDPELNNLNKTRFSTQNISGLLNKYNIIID
jgi:uncharacterized protein YjbI with pentapeptide repeats